MDAAGVAHRLHARPAVESTLMDDAGRSGSCYGSEGWGFESLRARQVEGHFCLRRGLGLKDGPGSARAAIVSVGLGWGFILSPRPGQVVARYPEGGRRQRMNP